MLTGPSLSCYRAANGRSGAIIALVLICCMISSSDAGAREVGENAVLQAIGAEWEERASVTDAVEIAWTRSITYPGGGRKSVDYTMSIGGIRYELTRQFHFKSGPATNRIVFDGSVSKSLDQIGASDPAGRVSRPSSAAGTNDIAVQPVLLGFRPLNSGDATVDLDEVRVVPGGGFIGAIECVVLEAAGEGGASRRYWLDPARGFVVLRFESTASGGASLVQDILYADDGPGGMHRPVSWSSIAETSSGDLRLTDECEVTACRFGRAAPDDAFEIEFPNGTRVFDGRTGSSYTVGETAPKGGANAAGKNPFGMRHLVYLGLLIPPFLAAALLARRWRGTQNR